jgi:hypothetical protein
MFKQLARINPLNSVEVSGLQASALNSERANLPAERGVAAPPQMLDRELDIAMPARLWSNWIPSDRARSVVRELRNDERTALERRAEGLRRALVPYSQLDDDRVAASVATMFGGFRSLRQQGDDAVAAVDGAMLALRSFPAWAIEKGCLAIQRGEAPQLDTRYPPNDAQICRIVTDIVKPYRAALTSANALLSAPVEPPAPQRPAIQHGCPVESLQHALTRNSDGSAAGSI